MAFHRSPSDIQILKELCEQKDKQDKPQTNENVVSTELGAQLAPLIGLYQLTTSDANAAIPADAFFAIGVGDFMSDPKYAYQTKPDWSKVVLALSLDGRTPYSFDSSSIAFDSATGTLTCSTTKPEVLQVSLVFQISQSTSPDGLRLLQRNVGCVCNGTIGVMPVQGENRLIPNYPVRFAGTYKCASPKCTLIVTEKEMLFKKENEDAVKLGPYFISAGQVYAAFDDKGNLYLMWTGIDGYQGRAFSVDVVQLLDGFKSSGYMTLYEFPDDREGADDDEKKDDADGTEKQQFSDLESFVCARLNAPNCASPMASMCEQAAVLDAAVQNANANGDAQTICDAISKVLGSKYEVPPNTPPPEVAPCIVPFTGYYQVTDDQGVPTGAFFAVTTYMFYFSWFGYVARVPMVQLSYAENSNSKVQFVIMRESWYDATTNILTVPEQAEATLSSTTFPACRLQFSFNTVYVPGAGPITSIVTGSVTPVGSVKSFYFVASNVINQASLNVYAATYKDMSSKKVLFDIKLKSENSFAEIRYGFSDENQDGTALTCWIFLPGIWVILPVGSPYESLALGSGGDYGLAGALTYHKQGKSDRVDSAYVAQVVV